MARTRGKRTDVEASAEPQSASQTAAEAEAATSPSEGLPASDTNGSTPEPSANGNGNGNGERKPIRVLSYLIGADTYAQCSIWQRDAVRRDGTPFTTWDCSVRKRYLDARDGEWKSSYSFHASELYAVQHGLQQAASIIAELRAADVPF